MGETIHNESSEQPPYIGQEPTSLVVGILNAVYKRHIFALNFAVDKTQNCLARIEAF